MEIEINENREIVLKKVYNGIKLETSDGEFMGICMRDTGFEFNYNGIWYEAKSGILDILDKSKIINHREINKWVNDMDNG